MYADMSTACIFSSEMAPSESVSSLTLCSGWSTASTYVFTKAVDDLVQKNPILTSKLIRVHNDDTKFLAIKGSHDVSINVIHLDRANPSVLDINFHSKSLKEKIIFLMHELEPLVPSLFNGIKQVELGSPLFNVTLIILSDTYACYSISLSHILGDGATYFNLVRELNKSISGVLLTDLDWDYKQFQIFDNDFYRYSEQDINNLIQTLISPEDINRSFNIDFMNQDEINILNKTMKEKDLLFLSRNDILVSLLGKAFGNDIVGYFVDLRQQNIPNITTTSSGSYSAIIPMLNAHIQDPNLVRKALINHYDIESGHIPNNIKDIGLITSWVKFTEFINIPLVKIECSVPSSRFIQPVKSNLAIIFKATPDIIAIDHNCNVNEMVINCPLYDKVLLKF